MGASDDTRLVSGAPAKRAGPRFTVVTATFNVAAVLPDLIASLQAQTDPDFEWVVADGASTDDTLMYLEEAARTLDVRVDSRRDFGIYDALNRAIRMARGQYYLVVGADDQLDPNAIRYFREACARTGADLVAAVACSGKQRIQVRKRPWEWLYAELAYVGNHSVSLAIRTALHERYGYYSNQYPIAADSLFLLQAIRGGAQVANEPFVAGVFSQAGASGANALGVMSEKCRILIALGHNRFLQLLLFATRFIVHYRKMGR
ncbi:glycosyltransferase [Castellaniella sp.]|uniref:glycosyltransferase n=1 Tax=Castellaniella sp. TaxID=1955812 RepID=UPI00356770EA